MHNDKLTGVDGVQRVVGQPLHRLQNIMIMKHVQPEAIISEHY